MTREDTVLLLSGGIDSVAAWVLLNQPSTLHFRFDTPYAFEEENRYWSLMHLGDSQRQVTDALRWLQPRPGDPELPLRNHLMVNIAWSLGYTDVILAAATDWAPDKRWLWARTAELAGRVAMAHRKKLRVLLPFQHWTKAKLIRTAVARHGAWWLQYVYSCYRGSNPPCGDCHACRRAMIAFAAARVVPPFETWDLPKFKSFPALLRWANATAPKHFALGSLPLGVYRMQEWWQAWRSQRNTRSST